MFLDSLILLTVAKRLDWIEGMREVNCFSVLVSYSWLLQSCVIYCELYKYLLSFPTCFEPGHSTEIYEKTVKEILDRSGSQSYWWMRIEDGRMRDTGSTYPKFPIQLFSALCHLTSSQQIE